MRQRRPRTGFWWSSMGEGPNLNERSTRAAMGMFERRLFPERPPQAQADARFSSEARASDAIGMTITDPANARGA